MPPVAGPAEDQKAKLLLALRSRYENRAALNDWKNANELDKAIHALEYLPRDVRSLRDLEGVKGFPEKMRKIVQKVLDNANLVDEPAPPPDAVALAAQVAGPPFIPAPNSGGRAMLIALYKETLKEGHPGFLHKDWLVQRAKDYTNRSMSGTALKDRKLLVDHFLIRWKRLSRQPGNLIRHKDTYEITSKGKKLARQILEEEGGGGGEDGAGNGPGQQQHVQLEEADGNGEEPEVEVISDDDSEDQQLDGDGDSDDEMDDDDSDDQDHPGPANPVQHQPAPNNNVPIGMVPDPTLDSDSNNGADDLDSTDNDSVFQDQLAFAVNESLADSVPLPTPPTTPGQAQANPRDSDDDVIFVSQTRKSGKTEVKEEKKEGKKQVVVIDD